MRLCVHLCEGQGAMARGPVFPWLWVILKPPRERTGVLRTMCRMGVVWELCF